MASENHNFIIKKALDNYSIGDKNISVVAHKILASYHNYDIPGANMETFPKYHSYKLNHNYYIMYNF